MDTSPSERGEKRKLVLETLPIGRFSPDTLALLADLDKRFGEFLDQGDYRTHQNHRPITFSSISYSLLYAASPICLLFPASSINDSPALDVAIRPIAYRANAAS